MFFFPSFFKSLEVLLTLFSFFFFFLMMMMIASCFVSWRGAELHTGLTEKAAADQRRGNPRHNITLGHFVRQRKPFFVPIAVAQTAVPVQRAAAPQAPPRGKDAMFSVLVARRKKKKIKRRRKKFKGNEKRMKGKERG
jgi:hypothetical protein